MFTGWIVSITKCSIVVGSPDAYCARNWSAITWVSCACETCGMYSKCSFNYHFACRIQLRPPPCSRSSQEKTWLPWQHQEGALTGGTRRRRRGGRRQRLVAAKEEGVEEVEAAVAVGVAGVEEGEDEKAKHRRY